MTRSPGHWFTKYICINYLIGYISQRWLEKICSTSHAFLQDNLVTYFYEGYPLLHPIKSGWILCLLWSIECEGSDQCQFWGQILTGLAASPFCLWESDTRQEYNYSETIRWKVQAKEETLNNEMSPGETQEKPRSSKVPTDKSTVLQEVPYYTEHPVKSWIPHPQHFENK